MFRTSATAAVVGAIVSMVATFGTRSAVDVRFQLQATSRGLSPSLGPQADLATIVGGARLGPWRSWIDSPGWSTSPAPATG